MVDRTAEDRRLEDDRARRANWKRWGPYLSERQWGTVREDYSAKGDSWRSFTHEDAIARTYRWGEDGLLGLCDRKCRLCLGLGLHNGRDPILKERLFGLTGPEGNHGEDVKELYYYLDATPTASWLKSLYKYPQGRFPYERLREENARRGRHDREFELLDTGIFDDDRYFDVQAEYGKASPDDLPFRFVIDNRGDAEATLTVLVQLWFRNVWRWGRTGDGYGPEPRVSARHATGVTTSHVALGELHLDVAPASDGTVPEIVFCDNETHAQRLYGVDDGRQIHKDGFHRYVLEGAEDAVRRGPEGHGTKAAAIYRLTIPPGGRVVLRGRLRPAAADDPFADHASILEARKREADAFYQGVIPSTLNEDERNVARQAYAGLVFTKKFYHYVVKHWLEGDPAEPPPPESRWEGRNRTFTHLFNRDVISMPDGWEYPWYAAWDLAFHMIPMARIDLDFAKQQMILLLREWYLHPNGQIPAYEFHFDDVNPPVHGWAVWQLYQLGRDRGQRDTAFLAKCFHKLLLNFTWWVNRTDSDDDNLFAGGFLGLDNIGLFDRSKPLAGGGRLEQADGTAWMAFYCGTMLTMALELASTDPSYEDIASKFFEHFVAIADAMNEVGGVGLWDEADGFYYDQLHQRGRTEVMRVRSLVGIIPAIACVLLDQDVLARMPEFTRRMRWFIENRPDLARHIAFICDDDGDTAAPESLGVGRASTATSDQELLLAIPSRERLVRLLRYVLDETEMLAPHGIRSLSRHHLDAPFRASLGGREREVRYVPGESDSGMFGGNSNWRGPVWFPINWLLIEALERYHHFYGDDLKVEVPTGSNHWCTLEEVARELADRLCVPFRRDAGGRRPCHGDDTVYRDDPRFRDLVLFYEYFDGDDGRGCGASHQTGWTALVATCLERVAKSR